MKAAVSAIALVLVLGVALTTPAGAQQQSQQAIQQLQRQVQIAGQALQQAAASPGAPDVQADQIIGKSVVNAHGNNIGDIEDLVVDANDNIYAIVSVGGFLGIGDKQVAIPVDRLQVSEENVVLMSQASEEELKRMPAYEQGSFRPYSE